MLDMEAAERVNPIEQKGTEPRLAMFGRSIPNPNIPHRTRNQDSFDIDQRAGVAMVADGIGGLSQGDKASQLARDFLMERLGGFDSQDPEAVKQQMSQALIEASSKINSAVYKSGTTTTAVKFIKSSEGLVAIIGHVGDSRAYLIRNRKVFRMTEDDSTLTTSNLSPEEKKRIQQKLDNIQSSQDIDNSEEARYWSQRHIITQFLGKEKTIKPHVYGINVKDRDMLLLTTDGVHDNLTGREIWSASTISHEEGLVNWIIHRARLRATGEEYDEALSREPLYKRVAERTRWKIKGKPKHFRAKGDDMTAVAIKIAA